MRYLQYIFLLAALASLLGVIWFPENWLQLLATFVVLILAGAVCSSSADKQKGQP